MPLFLLTFNTLHMSKFNTTKTTPTTTNLAGGVAYEMSNEMALVSLLLTSFGDDKYYTKASDEFSRLEAHIEACDKHFVAQAIVFARTVFGMRSITHVAASLLAKHIGGEEWGSRFFTRVVRRPDDMTEIVAYHKMRGQKLSNAMKRGFAKAFEGFDRYQISKYRGEGKNVKLVDIVNLCHPVESDFNGGAISALVKGELKQEETWEALLSQAGSDKNKKREVWHSLIDAKKLGYFALLRNLRNIIQLGDNELTNKTYCALTNENLIAKSLVLPFRFDTAYEEMRKLGFNEAMRQVSRACEISCKNVPKLAGKTLVALDVSGSMMGRPSQIGSLFAAVLAKSNDVDVMTFDDFARYVAFNPDDSLMTIKSSFRFTGGGTNFNSVFAEANKRYDRIILLSDMQSWNNTRWGGNAREGIKYYRHTWNPACKFYSFDLAGYGTLSIPERDTYCLAGFSDKIFDIMANLEADKDAMLNEIKKITL